MEHLTLETLARIVDEDASASEQAHLSGCLACRTSLDELRTQTEHLGALPALLPPRGDWRELEARLISEGLLHRGGARRWLALSLSSGWMKTAAVLAIFAAGAVTGSAISERGATPSGVVDVAASTLDEAERAVQFAEHQYAQSLLTYRQVLAEEGQLPGDDPVRRAQALELLVQAGQSAVRAAPDDPYINSFLVNVLTERRASTRTAQSGGNWF